MKVKLQKLLYKIQTILDYSFVVFLKNIFAFWFSLFQSPSPKNISSSSGRLRQYKKFLNVFVCLRNSIFFLILQSISDFILYNTNTHIYTFIYINFFVILSMTEYSILFPSSLYSVCTANLITYISRTSWLQLKFD